MEATKVLRTSLPLVIGFGSLLDLNGSFAQTWTLTSAPTNAWSAVASSADGTRLIAARDNGPIHISTDSGATWSSNNTPVSTWAAVASSADGSRLFAASAGQLFHISTNGGATWSSNNAFSANNLLGDWTSIACSTNGITLAATAVDNWDVYVFSSSDSAATYRLQTEEAISCISCGMDAGGVTASADGSKMVAAIGSAFGGQPSDGYFDVSWDSGVHWGQVGPLSHWTAVASSANGSNVVAAIGNFNKPLYTSTNAGLSWNATTSPVRNWISVASSADGTRLVAAPYSDSIYTSADSGASWISNDAPALNWTSVASSADGTKLVAASSQGIYVLQPAPMLNVVLLGTNLVLSWPSSATVFALQQNPDLTTSDWTPVADSPVLTNGQYRIVLSPTNDYRFYRLKSP